MPKIPADLAHHHAVVNSQLGDTWTHRQDDTELSVAVRGRLRVSAAEGTRAAVLAHMEVAIASDWMFAPELASGTVLRVLPEWTLPAIDLWADFPTGRLATAKARAFIEFIEGALDVSSASELPIDRPHLTGCNPCERTRWLCSGPRLPAHEWQLQRMVSSKPAILLSAKLDRKQHD